MTFQNGLFRTFENGCFGLEYARRSASGFSASKEKPIDLKRDVSSQIGAGRLKTGQCLFLLSDFDLRLAQPGGFTFRTPGRFGQFISGKFEAAFATARRR